LILPRPNLIKFAQLLITFAQICPNFTKLSLKFAKFCPNLPKFCPKNFLGDAVAFLAFPAPAALSRIDYFVKLIVHLILIYQQPVICPKCAIVKMLNFY